MSDPSDTTAASDSAAVQSCKNSFFRQLTPLQLIWIGVWALLFYLFSNSQLSDGGFWSQLAYGDWILEQRTLPVGSPFAPTLFETPMIDGAWLSQVLLRIAAGMGGVEALSLLFVCLTIASLALLTRVFYLQSRSVAIAHTALGIVCLIAWNRISVPRAEVFGMLCFTILLWILVADQLGSSHRFRDRWLSWLGIPALLTLWANLHESFVFGLLLLLCWLMGAALETAWRKRTIRGVLANPDVRRRTWLLELGVVAACLNPYGAELLLQVTWFADASHVDELVGWEPVEIAAGAGRMLVVSLLLAILVTSFSRRKVGLPSFLALLCFSFALGQGTRNVWWYASVYGVVLVPELSQLWARVSSVRSTKAFHPPDSATAAGRWDWRRGKLLYTITGLVMLWIGFTVSPAGSWLVNGQPRTPDQIYGPTIPWRATAYLREQSMLGQVYNPAWWGSWLAWDGPRGIRLFMTSKPLLAPRQVWIDYRIIRETRSGWDNVLARYDTTTVITDLRRQRTLTGYLRSSENWELQYEDDQAAVFRRKESS